MIYDIDYEIYKYINEQAEQYIEFDELLKQNYTTYEDARKNVKCFREKFYNMLSRYSIGSQNLVEMCYDLMKNIRQYPDNPDLQYLYFCIITDSGLLNVINSYERTEEQKIRNYFRQYELIQELSAFLVSCKDNTRKLCELREYLKKFRHTKNTESMEEYELLYHLTIQHTFLYESIGNATYKDNLNALIMQINSDEILKSVKPYIIFAVLARKTGMMQNREHFIPNLKAVFQYQDYNIYKDNGKNFNNYQSDIELYDHLRRTYIDDNEMDIELCDFCFANLSPLSEWYYMYCQPDFEIPMTFIRKIHLSESLSFPVLLGYDDYNNCDMYEFEKEHSKVYKQWEKTVTPDITEKFLQALCNNTDISEITAKLPYVEKYSEYAEFFMYQCAASLLEEKMLYTAENFLKI